jgi:hypothetical protein
MPDTCTCADTGGCDVCPPERHLNMRDWVLCVLEERGRAHVAEAKLDLRLRESPTTKG